MPPLSSPEQRQQLRLKSIGWALLAGGSALALGLVLGLEPGLRAGGCGFFYGLLAFHLQRVDPDDGHLQAGLVGAVCGIRSLALPLDQPELVAGRWGEAALALLQTALKAWWPLWWPLLGAALLLRAGQRLLPALKP
ncbi:MAG: hypothetical protein HQ527_09685 [Cyanobacteria bacterium]|nr:hypothetical protein [Cyanobacteria bacterium bin.51]